MPCVEKKRPFTTVDTRTEESETKETRPSTSFSSVDKLPSKSPLRTPTFQGAITMNDMGWGGIAKINQKETTFDKRLREKDIREIRWNSSFPAEYALPNASTLKQNSLLRDNAKLKLKKNSKRFNKVAQTTGYMQNGNNPESAVDNSYSSLGSISSAFNFHHHQGSDERDEIAVMKSILIREGYIKNLSEIVDRIRKGDSSALQIEDGNNILSLLLQCRKASIEVVSKICIWRQVFDSKRGYIWGGKNYLIKMVDDLNFLSTAKPLAEALGVAPKSMLQNPFMMPTSISDKKRSIDNQVPVEIDEISELADSMPLESKINSAERILLNEIYHEERRAADIESKPFSPSSQLYTYNIKKKSNKGSHDLLTWQERAEMQLKMLVMPMESTSGLHHRDSSHIMKRKGNLPALPVSPAKTLTQLMTTVNNSKQIKSCVKPSKSLFSTVTTPSKYSNIKSRLSADPPDHKKREKVTQEKYNIDKVRKKPKPKKKKRKAVNNQGINSSSNEFNLGGIAVNCHEIELLSKMDYPPHIVALVAATILIIISPGDLVPKDISWSTVRTVFSDGNRFLSKLSSFNDICIAPFKLRALEPFLNNLNFRPDKLIQVSSTAAALCGWVLETIERQINHDSCESPKRNQNLPLENDKKSSDNPNNVLDFFEVEAKPCQQQSLQKNSISANEFDEAEGSLLSSTSYTFDGNMCFVSILSLDGCFENGEVKDTKQLLIKLYDPKNSHEIKLILESKELESYIGKMGMMHWEENDWDKLLACLISQLKIVVDDEGKACLTITDLNCDRAQRTNRKKKDHCTESMVRKNNFDKARKLQHDKMQREAKARMDSKMSQRKEAEKRGIDPKDDNCNDKMEEDNTAAVMNMPTVIKERLKRLPDDNENQLAIIQIQSFARQQNAKKRVFELRQEKKRGSAVLKLQGASRQKLARNRVQEKRLEKSNKSVVKIQSLERQRQAKQKTKTLREMKKNKEAVKIQCLIRKRQAGCKVSHLRNENEALNKVDKAHLSSEPRESFIQIDQNLPVTFNSHEKHHAEATKIQSLARKRQAKKRVDSVRFQNKEYNAVKIQSIARRNQAKERVEQLKAQRNMEVTSVNFCESLHEEDEEYQEDSLGDSLENGSNTMLSENASYSNVDKTVAPPLKSAKVNKRADSGIFKEEDYNAIRIQCLARKRQAKKKVDSLRAQKLFEINDAKCEMSDSLNGSEDYFEEDFEDMSMSSRPNSVLSGNETSSLPKQICSPKILEKGRQDSVRFQQLDYSAVKIQNVARSRQAKLRVEKLRAQRDFDNEITMATIANNDDCDEDTFFDDDFELTAMNSKSTTVAENDSFDKNSEVMISNNTTTNNLVNDVTSPTQPDDSLYDLGDDYPDSDFESSTSRPNTSSENNPNQSSTPLSKASRPTTSASEAYLTEDFEDFED